MSRFVPASTGTFENAECGNTDHEKGVYSRDPHKGVIGRILLRVRAYGPEQKFCVLELPVVLCGMRPSVYLIVATELEFTSPSKDRLARK